VVGVPAQKMPMTSPTFLSSAGRMRRVRPTATQSQGLPMKTHGAGASSIICSPSHGLAGA
jgi:hypothetical protein